MATVGYTVENLIGGFKIVTWANLANGDDGTPFKYPVFADRTIQVTGTFGSGGTALVEGSNFSSAPTYATLNDPQGLPLSFTSAKIEQVLENTYSIRPRVSAGDGTTSLTVRLACVTPTAYDMHIANS